MDDPKLSGGVVVGVFAIAMITIGVATAFLQGHDQGFRGAQKEAVLKGVARWVADAEGKAVFEWVVNE